MASSCFTLQLTTKALEASSLHSSAPNLSLDRCLLNHISVSYVLLAYLNKPLFQQKSCVRTRSECCQQHPSPAHTPVIISWFPLGGHQTAVWNSDLSSTSNSRVGEAWLLSQAMFVPNTTIYKSKFIVLPGAQVWARPYSPRFVTQEPDCIHTNLILPADRLNGRTPRLPRLSPFCFSDSHEDNYLIASRHCNFSIFSLRWVERASLCMQWVPGNDFFFKALISIMTLAEVLLLGLPHIHYGGGSYTAGDCGENKPIFYSPWWDVSARLSLRKERHLVREKKKTFHFSMQRRG